MAVMNDTSVDGAELTSLCLIGVPVSVRPRMRWKMGVRNAPAGACKLRGDHWEVC